MMLLPNVDERITRWKPQLIAELVDDTPRIATKLVQLRQILPAADVAQIVLKRCGHVALENMCVWWALRFDVSAVFFNAVSDLIRLSVNSMVTMEFLCCRPMLLCDTEFQKIPAAVEKLKEKKFAQADICKIVERQPLWVVENVDFVFLRLGMCAQPKQAHISCTALVTLPSCSACMHAAV